MSSHDVSFSGSGIPQTVLPAEEAAVLERVGAAADQQGLDKKLALSLIAQEHPKSLNAWAALGDEATETIESYAYYRIGYHRGLDALRKNGWRGSGYVRWEHETNRPFLRCLDGLTRRAEEIGEDDEAERCALFLRQLDPTWPPSANS